MFSEERHSCCSLLQTDHAHHTRTMISEVSAVLFLSVMFQEFV